MNEKKGIFFTTNSRVGSKAINSYDEILEVVAYNNSENVVVKVGNSEDYKTTNWSNFERGVCKSPYSKSVFSIGFMGDGEYKSREENNGKKTKHYLKWFAMMQRCYSLNSLKAKPTYKGCVVCEEWHNFQTFAKWYDENYYTIENKVMCLDKDILKKGNKIYSPETCVFVSQDINKLLTRREVDRGEFPIGVRKFGEKYRAVCSKNGKMITIGTYNTKEETFYEYKKYKERVISEIAEQYKKYIPNKLYNAMNEYQVEIDD